MSKTLNTIVFDIHSQEKDAVALKAYATDANILSYKRTAPKRTKDFVGMEKSELKHTLIDPLTGALIGIQTVSTSILATATPAQRSTLNAVTKAAMVDEAYDNLIQDQRLPLAS